MSQQAPLPLEFWCPAPGRPVVIICQNAKKQGNLPFPRDTFPGLPLPPPWAPSPSVTAIVWDPSSHPTRVIALSPEWILAVFCLRIASKLGSGPWGPASPMHVQAASWPGILWPVPPRHQALTCPHPLLTHVLLLEHSSLPYLLAYACPSLLGIW